MKKKIVSAVAVVVMLLGVVGFTKYTEYSIKEPLVKVELGDKVSEKPETYVKANKEALKNTKLDLSEIDNMKVGTYQASAVYKNKVLKFEIEVVDTIKPEMQLVKTEDGVYRTVIGQILNGTALIKEVEDKAGIKTVTFSEGQTEGNMESENPAEKVALKFDEIGEKEITISVEDVNGNVAEEKVKVKVVEDYLAHVQGIQDLTVEQGSSVDWMEGITKDEKILDMTADASKVDINTAGEYTLTYVITGDDKETTVQKDVKVTVVTPQKAQSLANSGSTVKTTGGTKQKASTSSRNSKSSGSKNSAGNNSSSNSGRNPGQSWEANKDSEGYIDGPGGNTWESGSFDW